jgi:hypothetical protein
MHGFVNVFLAAVLALKAAQADAGANPPPALVRILEERDASSFTLDSAAIRWRGLEFPAAEIARVRDEFARSFGSCSFVEPVSDLETLGWLPRP